MRPIPGTITDPATDTALYGPQHRPVQLSALEAGVVYRALRELAQEHADGPYLDEDELARRVLHEDELELLEKVRPR